MKRFNLYLPEYMLDELKAKEKESGNSISSYIREFIKVGLKVLKEKSR